RAAACFADMIAVDKMVTDVKDAVAAGATDESDNPATATGGGRTPLATQLDLVGQCVEAGVATRVFSVSLGGFDFHADEKVAQERLLAELDSALSAFATRMGKTEHGRKVTVV